LSVKTRFGAPRCATNALHTSTTFSPRSRFPTCIARASRLKTSTIVNARKCCFKGFRCGAATELFERLRIDDWSFDAELLYLADRLGYAIREIPVEWHDESDSKVAIVSASLRSLWGLLRIRANALRGAYLKPTGIGMHVEEWRSPACSRIGLEADE
jgi:hypothetical protein